MCDNIPINHLEGCTLKEFKDYLQKFGKSISDVFVSILLGLVLMALGYGLLSLFG